MQKDSLSKLNANELIDSIKEKKAELKDKLLILGHHYQTNQIIDLADFSGDSFELAKYGSENQKAKYIVFCGVRFMAEAAAILAKPDQIVQHPDVTAGCPLADMADINHVEIAWKDLDEIIGTHNITPLTYMNSDSELKAFCGKNGGSVTTSSNCKKIFNWSFSQRDRILFFPDENLGTNVASSLNIPESEIITWDPNEDLGGNRPENISRAKVILWKGYCHVHTHFATDHVRQIRTKYPEANIIVHPETKKEVVDLCDETGSTSQIIRYIENSPAGSTIVVGTELNLVSRMSEINKDKTIFPLSPSICPNMMRIGLLDLALTLENIGNYNVVNVREETKKYARTALRKMIEITSN